MKSVWQTKPLGDVCKTGSGGTPLKSKNEFYESGTIPWLMSGEVSQGEVHEATRFITKKGLENSSARIFPVNTVLVAMYGATAGQVGILKFEASTNQAVCGILPNEQFIPEFLYYLFLSKKDELISQATGNAQPNISQIKIKNTHVPIINLNEQQLIVAILDQAFEGIAKARANAEQNLQNARALFQSHLQSVFTQRGDEWVQKRLDELGTITSSKRIFKNEYVSTGVPFYRTKEIKELANGKEISTELYISRARYEDIKRNYGIPLQGDILLTAIGTIGEIYVVENDTEFYFKDGNVLWLKDFDAVNPSFLKYALISFVATLNNMAQGSAYNALPIHKLNSHKIYVPLTVEQIEIVNILNKLKSETQRLEAFYQRKIECLDDLKKSLLQQAFAGEL